MINREAFKYPKKELLETIVFGYSFSSMKIYIGAYIGYNSDTEQYILQSLALQVFYADIITGSKEALLGEVVTKTIENFEKKFPEAYEISADKIL